MNSDEIIAQTSLETKSASDLIKKENYRGWISIRRVRGYLPTYFTYCSFISPSLLSSSKSSTNWINFYQLHLIKYFYKYKYKFIDLHHSFVEAVSGFEGMENRSQILCIKRICNAASTIKLLYKSRNGCWIGATLQNSALGSAFSNS